jgi:hypothetical protein
MGMRDVQVCETHTSKFCKIKERVAVGVEFYLVLWMYVWEQICEQ